MSRKSNFILNDGFDKNFRRGAEIDFAVNIFRNFHFISCDTPLVTMKKKNLWISQLILIIKLEKYFLKHKII